MRKLAIGIIGVGRFAGSHHTAIQKLEAMDECRLHTTCDPSRERLDAASTQYNLGERNVARYADYREMLENEAEALDIVTVPTPITLHAPMHQSILEAGLACYLEKPPTLDPHELNHMLAVEAEADRETVVGFNFIVENTRQALKERLLNDEFGALQSIGFVGLWARPTTYYQRNNWAGQLLSEDGKLILDSCIGNALAHHVHNALFWAGTDDLFSWDPVLQVESELYRAHAIPGFDTCFVSALGESGVPIRLGVTHACDGSQKQYETLTCEKATLHYDTSGNYRIEWKNGTVEEAKTDSRNLIQENFRAYFAYIHGEVPRPLTRLVDSIPFVHLNALAYLSAGEITPVPVTAIERNPHPAGGETVALTGVRDACTTFVETGKLPATAGYTWGKTQSPRTATRHEIPDLLTVVQKIAESPAP